MFLPQCMNLWGESALNGVLLLILFSEVLRVSLIAGEWNLQPIKFIYNCSPAQDCYSL